jgi:protein-S-isoprenylcysteine O-methyltransferase Ste14
VLTASEKRFIKSWEEQRQGGKTKYYLLYIVVGTFPAILVLSFLASMFGWFNKLWITISLSVIIVTIATIRTWAANEKKFKGIIQREIKEGMMRDEGGTVEP